MPLSTVTTRPVAVTMTSAAIFSPEFIRTPPGVKRFAASHDAGADFDNLIAMLVGWAYWRLTKRPPSTSSAAPVT